MKRPFAGPFDSQGKPFETQGKQGKKGGHPKKQLQIPRYARDDSTRIILVRPVG